MTLHFTVHLSLSAFRHSAHAILLSAFIPSLCIQTLDIPFYCSPLPLCVFRHSAHPETERGPERSRRINTTVGDSGLCCCTCFTYFERQLTPLCVDAAHPILLSAFIPSLCVQTVSIPRCCPRGTVRWWRPVKRSARLCRSGRTRTASLTNQRLSRRD